VVVRAYIDESVGKYKTFALGCVIAKGTEWTWISRDWKKCLERKNRELRRAGRKCISRYHATDCQIPTMNLRGGVRTRRNRL